MEPRYEVEAKVVLAAPEALRERLRALGAERLGETRQEDAYFHHPARDLAQSDEAVRVRREEAEDAQGLVRWTLTYKGPRLKQDSKARPEHDVPAGVDPTAFLEALGFERGPVVRKTREAWRHGELVVAVDAVDDLGTFAEVEAVGPDPVAAGVLVEAALERLGLAGANRVLESYLELLASATTT